MRPALDGQQYAGDEPNQGQCGTELDESVRLSSEQRRSDPQRNSDCLQNVHCDNVHRADVVCECRLHRLCLEGTSFDIDLPLCVKCGNRSSGWLGVTPSPPTEKRVKRKTCAECTQTHESTRFIHRAQKRR